MAQRPVDPPTRRTTISSSGCCRSSGRARGRRRSDRCERRRRGRCAHLLPLVRERLPRARRRSAPWSTSCSSTIALDASDAACPSAGTRRRRSRASPPRARSIAERRARLVRGGRAGAAAPRAGRGARLEGRRPVHGDPRRGHGPDRDAAAVRHARRARPRADAGAARSRPRTRGDAGLSLTALSGFGAIGWRRQPCGVNTPQTQAGHNGARMTLTRAQFQDWLDRYVAAWKSYDPQQIGDLFSEDVEYRYHPQAIRSRSRRDRRRLALEQGRRGNLRRAATSRSRSTATRRSLAAGPATSRRTADPARRVLQRLPLPLRCRRTLRRLHRVVDAEPRVRAQGSREDRRRCRGGRAVDRAGRLTEPLHPECPWPSPDPFSSSRTSRPSARRWPRRCEQDGLRVLTAADGREALERFRASPVDLVLLDLMLPELSGIEVCRIIRREVERADPDADGTRQRDRQGRRTRGRRRRLRHQAVQPARAAGARPGASCDAWTALGGTAHHEPRSRFRSAR